MQQEIRYAYIKKFLGSVGGSFNGSTISLFANSVASLEEDGYE